MEPENEPALSPAQALQEEIERVREKRAAAKDRDVQEALDMKIADLARRLASMPKPEEAEAEIDLTPPTPAQLEAADMLIRQARVEKMRGNKTASTELLRKAVESAPTAPSVLEALGDDLMERRQAKEARQVYARAVKLDPKNVGLERKYANVVLGTTNTMTIEDQLRYGLSDTPLRSQEQMASTTAAVFLSIFLPGAGHIVIGKTTTGIVILTAWAISAIWLGLMFKDFLGFLASLKGGNAHFSVLVFVPLFTMCILFIGALASLKGPKTGGRSKVERPVPPVNMKFD